MKKKLIFLTTLLLLMANVSVFSRLKVALVLSGGGADKINRSGNELNQIALEMKSSIDRISRQIDEFKV